MSGGAVSWASKQQTTVAHSSAEAEYVALSLAAKECVLIRRLYAEISGQNNMDPTVFLEDNQACALWSKNPIHHARQKHIDICHHAIRDWVADKTMVVKYVRSSDQLADALTKPLARDLQQGLPGSCLGMMCRKSMQLL